ncbi:maleylpyruvate isomerase N-terminal domain-containing protein [Amycolatopsis sp. NBRC 101858]|uniref:maleylpyruvate isomerase N-terminal domain-containing protein n=1 Tax=Amycolatopsis sp. NBRC 101858 TaxID=3032200 RepID=UPI003335B4E7
MDPALALPDLAAAGAARPRAELLERRRTGRAELAAALRDLPPDRQFPWHGSAVTPRFPSAWKAGRCRSTRPGCRFRRNRSASN